MPADKFDAFPPLGWLLHARRKIFGDYAFLRTLQEPPDKNQENLFFALLQNASTTAR